MLNTLKGLGITPDFLVHHFYPETGKDNDALLLQATANWAQDAAELRQEIMDYLGSAGTNVELLCTENNSDSGPLGRQSTSVVNGLYLADSMAELMKTEFSSYLWWIFTSGPDKKGDFNSGLYGWRTNGDFGFSLNVTNKYPTYYAMKLMQYFAQPGDSILSIPSGYLLSVFAAKSPNGGVSLLAINKDPTNAATREVALVGFIPGSVATVRSFGIPQDEAARTNGPVAARDIATSSFTSVSSNLMYSFPPYSLTLFSFTPPPPALVLIPPKPRLGGSLVFQVQGQAGLSYVLQTSTNLTAQWSSVATNVLTNGILNVTNPVTQGFPAEFWRAVWEP
jgi:hypothetical protein